MMKTKNLADYTALRSVAAALQNHGVRIKAEQIIHENPTLRDDTMDYQELIKVLKRYDYRGMLLRPAPDELHEIPVPAVVRFKNGKFAMLGVNSEESVFFLDPEREAPVAMSSSMFRKIWAGEVLLLKPRLTWKEFLRRYSLDWYYSVILRYKKYFAEVFLASLFLQLMGISLPLFTQVIIDKVIGNNGLSTLTVLGIAMLVIAVVQSSMNGLKTYLLNQTTTKLDAVLGTRLFHHLISLPIPYFEHRRVGDTMMRVNYLNQIREFLTGTTLTTMLDVLFSLVFVAVIFYYSVKLSLVALLIIPFFVVQTFWGAPISWHKMMEAFNAGVVRRSFLIEAVTGMQTIKALAIEPQFLHKWERLVGRHIQMNFNLGVFNLGINCWSGGIQAAENLLVFWVGGHMVMSGEFTLGQLIAFQMLAGQATGPMLRLLSMWPQVQNGVMGLKMIGDILHQRMEPVLLPSPPGLLVIRGDIEARDVTFRYRPDLPPALDKVSFSIKAGEKIGIVGRSGSGKSTLASIIEKVYLADSGNITIDGTDIRHADYNWLRHQMGVVMQDNYLFDGSIRDNIAAGKPAASMAEVIQAAKLAGAHEFILELDEGYDTRVGERGAGLSGGQRQRIAIARALLTDPRIIIFDEATSALDYESERIVMRNLERIAADRTMLIIAHRLVTVERCDRIFVLDHGRIVEQGTHEELLALGGIYKHLYDCQAV